MSPLEIQVLPGHIFEEYAVLNLDDLSRMCVVDRRRIVELVDEGILRVMDTATPDWRFDGANLRRARVALRLERDLELNLAGVALALELMDELEQLRRQLRRYR